MVQAVPAGDCVAPAGRSEYAPKGVEVVGVTMDARGWPAATPFVAANGVDYPVLLGTLKVARDYGGLNTLPLSLFLDRRGRIAAAFDVVLDEASARGIIEALLEQ